VLKLSVYEFCMCSRVSVLNWILCGMNWYYMRFVIENLVHLVLLSSPLCLTSVGWGFWGIAWFFWVSFEFWYLQWVQSMLYGFSVGLE